MFKRMSEYAKGVYETCTEPVSEGGPPYSNPSSHDVDSGVTIGVAAMIPVLAVFTVGYTVVGVVRGLRVKTRSILEQVSRSIGPL